MRHHPCAACILISRRYPARETGAGRQFDWGGCLLKGNGGVHKGRLSADGNRAGPASGKAGFTARPTRRAVTKVGASDPTVRRRTAEAHRIKATPGITG